MQELWHQEYTILAQRQGRWEATVQRLRLIFFQKRITPAQDALEGRRAAWIGRPQWEPLCPGFIWPRPLPTPPPTWRASQQQEWALRCRRARTFIFCS